MNLLAVETSTELCSVALLRDGELFVEEAMAENRHSDLLVPMLRRVLDRARLAPARMDAFAFGQGPGSFTGLRIACGIVWVNCWMLRDLRVPFGGMKASGVGREGGVEALHFFTEPKNVCVKL